MRIKTDYLINRMINEYVIPCCVLSILILVICLFAGTAIDKEITIQDKITTHYVK